MDRYEYRQMMVPVKEGIKLVHRIWDNLKNEPIQISVNFSSKYACKQWIKRNQESIEETK